MKLFKRFKSKKGFTLTEVLVSIVIFALMSAIVMQILAIAIAQHRKNDSVDKDMDTQISNLVQENALVERDTVNLVMNRRPLLYPTELLEHIYVILNTFKSITY